MRNLKRALSLALATVMTMGLMMVGTGASYEDVKATDNVEAIEVLQAVGIMTGDENGDFNPDANVTRNEIAVIMSNLLNLDYDYYRGVNPFTDVPDWAAPYVAACAAEGVVAGIGGTQYGGSNNVTAAQAALMIMKALGYFQYQADFENDWQIATIRQASYINLFDGINANAETALTRNQIAQLVLNGLKANMVTFTGTVGAEINGVTIGYKAEYTAKTNANKKYDSIDTGTSNIGADDKYYVQLGEELYNGDLKLNASTDVFGRPAYNWEYKAKEIGTYVDETQMIQEYTTEVTGDMLYDLLTRNTVNTYSLTVVIDGVYEEDAPAAVAANWFSKDEINRNNDDGLGGTGNGVLTQVFVDNENDEIIVTIINTYLALAANDYDAKKDEVSLNVYGIDKDINNVYYKHQVVASPDMKVLKASGEDFAISDMKEKDAVLVTVADGAIQTMSDCEVMAGITVDAFETDHNQANKGTPSLVEIDGTEYKFADAAEFDYEVMQEYTTSGGVTNLKDMTYNIYMDAYGYVIGVEEVEKADNFVFIAGVDLQDSMLGARNAKASAIFLDGTMKTIEIDMTKSNLVPSKTNADSILNTWCTYTVNTKDVYTVTVVPDVGVTGTDNVLNVPGASGNPNGKYAQFQYNNTTGSDVEINNRHIIIRGNDTISNSYYNTYGTDETVYLTVSVKDLALSPAHFGYIDEVDSVVTGIGNANLLVWDETVAANKADATDNNPGDIIAANASKGVYNLYDKNGDVIAAVVVGEDAGSSKNLVYTHAGSTYRETYNSTTGQWTWSRKVISNGQEVSLTEVGDGTSVLVNMQPNTWYQVKYNAEGNVIAATRYDNLGWTDGVEYVTDAADIPGAVATEDTVLYYSTGVNGAGQSNLISSAALKLDGNTLWLDTAKSKAMRVSNEVNVVLIQYNNNVKKTYFETGVSSLKSIVNELNERHASSSCQYMISAILEKNVATSIVISDPCNTYQGGNWQGSNTIATVALSGSYGSVNAHIYSKSGALLDSVTGYAWKLEMRAPGQAAYDVVMDGNDFATDLGAINAFLSGNFGASGTYSFRLTVDGVVSNTLPVVKP